MSRKNSDGKISLLKGKFISIDSADKYRGDLTTLTLYKMARDRIEHHLSVLARLPKDERFKKTRKFLRQQIKAEDTRIQHIMTDSKFWLYKGMVFVVPSRSRTIHPAVIRDARVDREDREQPFKKNAGKYTYWYSTGGRFNYEKGDVEAAVTPFNKLNHIAVEVEMIVSNKSTLIAALNASSYGRYVQLKRDGSIGTNGSGDPVEMVICCPEHKYRDAIGNIMQIVNSVGAYVNKSCGLHVHLDMRNRNVSDAYTKLVDKQKLLQALVPQERVLNEYCKPNVSKLMSKETTSRYKAINPQSYAKHKTLEVRLHHGTLHTGKIINWVNLLLGIINGANVTEDSLYSKIIAMKTNNATTFKIEQEHQAFEEVV